MITTIETLSDLKKFLESLTESQLSQRINVILDNENYLCEEVTEITENIFVNNYDEEDYGTIEELKNAHGHIDMSDYHESNQKGLIYFSID